MQIRFNLCGFVVCLQQLVKPFLVCFSLGGSGVGGFLPQLLLLGQLGVHVLHEPVHDLNLCRSQIPFLCHFLKRVEGSHRLVEELGSLTGCRRKESLEILFGLS